MKYDPLAILETRHKRLDGFSYKLNGDRQYGLDVVMSGDLDLDEGTMSVVIPFADGNARDGVGDLLEVGGIRTERHQQNPIVLFDHGKQVSLPIGLAEDPATGEYTVRIDPVVQRASAKAFFYQGKGGLGGEDYDHALFCEQLFDLMAQRYIRAGSIGYQVVKALKLSPDYERGTPEGLHLLVTLMLECSAVVLPANQDTVRKALSLPKVCGKPLSPMLVKSLSAYAPEVPTIVGFAHVVKDIRDKYKKKGMSESPKQTLQDTVNSLSDEELDGIAVYYTPDQPYQVCIDVMDWGDSDIGKVIGNAVEVLVGKDNVIWHNEQRPPKEREWEEVEPTRRKKSLKGKSKGFGQTPSPANLTGYQPGETVYARSYLSRVDPQTGKTGNFARTGDRLTVVSTDGGVITVRRPDGATGGFSSAHLRRGGVNKNFKELREKYRPTKGLRRRMRKSVAGSSIIHIHGKDLQEAREYAEGKGIKFHHIGPSKYGPEKVKLIGDDGVIDEMAKKYGRRVLRKGMESMAKKELNSKDKALDKNGALAAARKAKQELEKRGAKVKEPEFDSIAETVTLYFTRPDPDAQASRKLVDGISRELGGSRNSAEWIEWEVKNMAKKELNRKTKELPTEVPVGGEAEHEEHGGEEPYGAQILRRMHEDHSILMKDYDDMMGPLEHEHVKKLLQKTLEDHASRLDDIENHFSKHYPDLPGIEGAKDMEGGEEEEKPEEGKEEKPEGETPVEDTEAVPTDSEEDEETPPEEAVEGMKSLRRRYSKKTFKGKKKSLKESKRKGMEPDQEEMGDHEKETVGKAASFLKDLSETPELTDEHKMEAYHYHKGLDDIGGMLGMGSMPEEEIKQKGVKSEIPGDEEYWQEEAAEPEHQHPHAETIGGASQFLKSISTEQNFGDPHREEALVHHKGLSDLVGMGEEGKDFPEMDEEDEEAEVHEPGEMGEKGIFQGYFGSQEATINKSGDDLILNVGGRAYHGKVSGNSVKWTNPGPDSDSGKMVELLLSTGQVKSVTPATKSLKKTFIEQQKQLKELTRTLNGITSRLKV